MTHNKLIVVLCLSLFFSSCTPILNQRGKEMIGEVRNDYACYEVIPGDGWTNYLQLDCDYLSLRFTGCSNGLNKEAEISVDEIQELSQKFFDNCENNSDYQCVRVILNHFTDSSNSKNLFFKVIDGKLLYEGELNFHSTL